MEDKTKRDPTAAKESFELAGITARLVANIIDGIILTVVLTLLLVIVSWVGVTFIQFIGLALPVVYHWYYWTRRDGQTPGKSVVRVRVVKIDGSELSDTDAFIRSIGYHVSGLLCGLGFIWAIFDKNNQTWHDKLARTYVVRAEGERNTVNIGG